MSELFVVQPFAGIVPKVADHLLQEEQATVAENCRLVSGELTTWKGDSLVEEQVNDGEAKTLINYDNFWFFFNEEREFAKAPVVGDEYDRIVSTDGVQPRITDTTLVAPNNWQDLALGIPAPTVAPVATPNGTGSGGTITDTFWVYTYVRTWSDGKVDEGPPSPVSNLVELDSADTTTISNITALPNYADHGVTKIYLYRTQTGSQTADFQFVKELLITDTSTIDDVAGDELGETLQSANWGPPPDELRGIINVGNGILAGFVGNTVWLSDVFQPHGWSESQTFPCENQVVALGAYNNTLIVLTEGFPLSVYISSPTQIQVVLHKELLPCQNLRSAVSTRDGVIYAAHNGLIMIDQQGPRSITAQLYTERQWADLNPSSIVGIYYDNQYFFFWQKLVEYIDENGEIQERIESDSVIINLIEPAAAVTSAQIPYGAIFRSIDQNDLFYTLNTQDTTQILKWEGSETRTKSFVWKSKEFISKAGRINLGAARVLARFFGTTIDPETGEEFENEFAKLLDQGLYGSYNEAEVNTYSINGDRFAELAAFYMEPKVLYFNLYVDGIRVFTKEIKNDRVFKLPTKYSGRRFHFEVTGNIDVQQIQAATCTQEIV